MSTFPPQNAGGDPPRPEPSSAADPLVATTFAQWWTKVVGVLTRSWQSLLVIQLVTVVPAMILAAVIAVLGGGGSTTVTLVGAVSTIVGMLVLIVFALLAQGASVYVVARQATGEEVGAGPALRFAAARALPLLGWGLLAGLLVVLGLTLLVVPGLYLMAVFAAALTGVIMFERGGIGRAFELVNPAFGQTLGRLITFLLAAVVYSGIAEAVVSALVGQGGFASAVLSNVLHLPVTFALVGVGVVTYASLRHREDPAVTTAVLAAELDRP